MTDWLFFRAVHSDLLSLWGISVRGDLTGMSLFFVQIFLGGGQSSDAGAMVKLKHTVIEWKNQVQNYKSFKKK